MSLGRLGELPRYQLDRRAGGYLLTLGLEAFQSELRGLHGDAERVS
jgi:hypothetical protein